MLQVRNPNYEQRVKQLFDRAAFISEVGIQLRDAGPGWCETELELLPKHLQQDSYVHAGVQATMADHTAGAAAGTLIAECETVLTVEFKINLLRAAQGDRLRCRSEVIKPGRSFSVAESDVFAINNGQEKQIAKAIVTLAIVENARREQA